MAKDTRLSTDQIERYSRQILVPDLGGKSQVRLLQSRVLVIGAGGLGSPAAFYLAAAGIGTVGIVDPDRVELSNLQRQILHATHDIGRPKVESAGRKLHDLNPDVEVKTYCVRFESSNAAEIAAVIVAGLRPVMHAARNGRVVIAGVAVGEAVGHERVDHIVRR